MSVPIAEERLVRLDQAFLSAAAELHSKLESLIAAKPFIYQKRPRGLPSHVVYLFSDGDAPLYVGRSRNFSQRLGNHCRPSSTANQSSFAFKLGCEASALIPTPYAGPHTRQKLLQSAEFISGFSLAKARLNEMQIRFVEEEDSVRQALLEIYCAVALRTPYNDFETH